MRVFITLELPKEIKKEVGKIQQELKRLGIQARWVKPEICHLTLVFLGSITPDKVETIGKILKVTAGQTSPINLRLAKIGCFPNSRKSRIIFISLAGELDKLKALTDKTRKGLKKSGFWFDEKPFFVHLTLARLKKRQDLTKIVNQIKIEKINFQTNEIALISSTLTPTGSIYQNLISCRLEMA